MADRQPPQDLSTRERLTAMEDGLRHFRQIFQIRNDQIWDALSQLKAHNQRQDDKSEETEEKLLGKIEKIYGLLWSGMKWLGTLLVTTLLAIILKALNLY